VTTEVAPVAIVADSVAEESALLIEPVADAVA
jgi:hypothetical protein